MTVRLSPTIHKFGDEFVHSGLSVVRHTHHPEFFEGLREYGKEFHWIAHVTVFANRSTKLTQIYILIYAVLLITQENLLNLYKLKAG